VSRRKKIVLGIVVLLLVLFVWQYELIAYAWMQGKGQLSIVWNAVPVEDVLADPAFPDSLKQKLEIILLARQFAMDSLGLKNSDVYTTFYDQKGQVLLWNLSACQPFRFEAYRWSFPFLGSFPYKGYFNKEKALKAAEKLEAEGWETRVRPVSGWSTLGWFKDPILSNMLSRDDGELAELIIHELTHSTVFVKNQVTFNENLAQFVGEEGAKAFLKSHFRDDSKPLEQYQNELTDSRKFTTHILRGTRSLDSLYSSFSEAMTTDEKLRAKETLLDEIILRLDTVSFADERYKRVFERNRPTNAYFIGFLTYHSVGDSLKSLLINQYHGDLIQFIEGLKKEHGQ
jgi:predicted aminopeptidase